MRKFRSSALFKPGLAIPALAALVFLSLFGIDYYRHRLVRSNADLFRFVPHSGATTLFADVRVLRGAGVLHMLSGERSSGDTEYRQFVRETRFDYQRDLDAVAGEVTDEKQAFVVQARFDWDLLRAYAERHGGRCSRDTCELLSSRPGRYVTFGPIQPDVLAVSFAARPEPGILRSRRGPRPAMPSNDPVWVSVSPALLKDPAQMPLALRIFAISVQSAQPVVISLGAAERQADVAFVLKLRAHCGTLAMAETTRNQLQIQTNMIRLQLAREHQSPNPADLTGLVAGGAFQIVGPDVVGTWPVTNALLESLR